MAAREYGYAHQQARAAMAKQVSTGCVNCCLCGQPIDPREDWHLDHNPHDPTRTTYRGAAHARCNTSDGARRRHSRKNRRWVL